MRCVLVATDGSESSRRAVETGVELVRSFGSGAQLHVATVVDRANVPGMMGKHPAGAPDLLAEQANAALQQAAEVLSAAGTSAQIHCLSGDVVDAILACAREVGADLLVAGYRGRSGLARIVMGSISGKIVRASDVPVVIVRAV